MRISVWSAMLIEQSPETMIKTMAAHGYRCTELSDEHAAELLRRGDPGKVAAELRRFAADHDFCFPQGHLRLPADIAHPDAAGRIETVNTLRDWLDLFAGLGIAAAVLHPGGRAALADGVPAAEVNAWRTASLRQLTAHAAGSGVTICLENMRADAVLPHGHRAEDLLQMIDDAGGDGLGICLDTGHLNLAGRNQGEFIRACGPRLRALHLADNMGVYDDHLLPYSVGKVDWAEVIAALKEAGYAGLYNFEAPGERNCPLPVRELKLDYALALGRRMFA